MALTQRLEFRQSQSLVMTFSADPHLRMAADSFSGNAVVFLATATFVSQTSAALRERDREREPHDQEGTRQGLPR